MTTHTFSNDWDTFQTGIGQHQDAVNQEANDLSAYQQLVAKFQAMRSNPEEALMYFLAVISASTQPDNSANILGLLDDQMGVTGKSLLVTAQATQLINDIENITNCTTTADLPTMVANLDKLLDAFNPAGPQDSASTGVTTAFNQAVQKSFDPNAINGIFAQLQTLRSTIFMGNHSTDSYDPTDSSNTYFNNDSSDPNYSKQLQSFREMQTDLSLKNDPKKATEAQKALSDALSVLSSTTQGVNSALNEAVSQQTGFEKNVQSFIASLMKSLIDLISSIVQTSSK